MPRKRAVVVHSGGMDSSLCLALAIREFGVSHVLSLSFAYSQRHGKELKQAQKICAAWNVDHAMVEIDCLQQVTHSALIDHREQIRSQEGVSPNTLVVGRNGLMVRLAAIKAHHLQAHDIYMGVMGRIDANSGYRDCSREYMDLMQEILRIDLDDPTFTIRTPLVLMTKKQTLELAHQLGVLEFLLVETITCYEGIPHLGCQVCPACLLRNEGLRQFHEENPEIPLGTLPL